jgi:NAD(P)H dehydrogenase (quinone)
MAYNGGKNGDLDTILFPIHHGMLYFTGMTVLPPFISFAPVRKTPEERAEELQRYTAYLMELQNQPALYSAL